MTIARNKFSGYGCDGLRRLCKGGGGGDSVTTQEIPAELKPLATKYANDAMALSNTPYQGYGGDRYADLNGVQGAGLQSIMNRAMGGSATMNNAESNLNQMISGTSNPYLDAQVQKATDQVKGQVNSQFNNSNYGTTAHQETLAKGVGDTATQMYGNAYAGDRANQLQAIGQAPAFGNQAYTDASQMLNAGQVLQDQEQQDKDFSYQQYTDQQNDPYKKLAAMSGVFGSQLGSQSSTQSSGGGK